MSLRALSRSVTWSDSHVDRLVLGGVSRVTWQGGRKGRVKETNQRLLCQPRKELMVAWNRMVAVEWLDIFIFWRYLEGWSQIFYWPIGILYATLRRRQWHPTPVLFPGKSHGWRSLVGCSPWGCEESDMTGRLHFHFSLSCTGEGKSNPLQCSCLENPRDWGAWWAAVYGVAQSRTRLKRLSSSSMLHWNSISHIVYGIREKDSEEEVSSKQAGLTEVCSE